MRMRTMVRVCGARDLTAVTMVVVYEVIDSAVTQTSLNDTTYNVCIVKLVNLTFEVLKCFSGSL